MIVSDKTVVVNGKEVRYTHVDNGSPVVCFMFSGAGYTYEKPLLYYSTMIMLENRFDVVQVHYSYEQDLFKLPLADITELVFQDVDPVITEVLQSHSYQEIIFAGKSLGTIPMINRLMKNDLYSHFKMMLLTPLLKYDELYEALLDCGSPALMVIGEKDSHFIPEKISKLANNPNIQIETVPHANHSLDIEPFNTAKSIHVLQEIMGKIDNFIQS